MDKETLRMQLLSGVITESEYKAKLEENPTKESLNENFVGMGMVGNIFDREKTDYELAFEHFAKGTSLNEEVEEELEEGNDDLFTSKRFYKRTDNPRINILSHMNAINEIVMDMLETDIVKGYGPDERDFIYQEYMKFANAVKNLVK